MGDAEMIVSEIIGNSKPSFSQTKSLCKDEQCVKKFVSLVTVLECVRVRCTGETIVQVQNALSLKVHLHIIRFTSICGLVLWFSI